MGRGETTGSELGDSRTLYYHAAAIEDRAGIAERGLQATHRRFWTAQLDQPQATYLWLQPEDALDYAHERLWRDIHGLDEQANRQAQGYDVWLCSLDAGVTVEDDPAATDAVFTSGHVRAIEVLHVVTRENLVEPAAGDE